MTPFIANWPAVIKGGGPVNQTSSHLVDIIATFVDITGADYPTMSRGEKVGPMDGVSLLPALKKGTTIEREKPVFFQWQSGKAVIDGNWKLVAQEVRKNDKGDRLWAFATGKWELYDLSTDRTEINNLAESHRR